MYVKKITAFILILSFIFLFACSKGDEDNTVEIIQQPEKTNDFNIVYKTVNNIELKMDIYYPVNKKYEKSPLIVAFYGGGWISGDKTQIAYIFAPIITELLENGYTVAMPQYRYAEESSYFPAQIDDCEEAIEYLKNYAEKYNIDADSIGVMGYSAGAQLAMLASYSSDLNIKYCLSFAGPTKMYGEELHEYSLNTLMLIENLFNGTYEEKKDDYETGSPYYYLDCNASSKTPLFLVHDESDHIVPFSQSQIMYDKALEAGIECELLKLNGFYHQIEFDYSHSEIINTILDFIYKYS